MVLVIISGIENPQASKEQGIKILQLEGFVK